MPGSLVQAGRHPAAAGANAATTTVMSDATARAVKRSKEQFTADMRKLLDEAKRYLGDVCWQLEADDEIIYGHRAILYARANAAFQSRFLNPNGSARLQAIMSGSSLSLQSPTSPMPGASLTLVPDARTSSRSVSPGALSVESFATSSSHSLSPASKPRSPIQVCGTESAFFKSLLDFFYTAATPMGEVFTFLFEDSSYVDKEDAMDRLSQDLLFMWRSKLFADMQIKLFETVDYIQEDDESSSSDTRTISEERLFPAHRAILAARCPYFKSMFLSPFSDSDSSLFALPSPPFTPPALHFVLAYLYTGCFSLNRTFDLAVAMDIWKCATYLNHDLLQEEVQCRIVDMCHGFLGCCKTCRYTAVRTYAFAIMPEVNAKRLQSQAEDVVLDHFGELRGKDVGDLPYSTQKELLVDKCSRTNASNAATAMRGIMRIRTRLAGERNAAWADHIISMLLPLEDRIRHFIKNNFAEMATSPSFIELVEGIGFSNDVLERLLMLLVEALSEKHAASMYETLVGKLLLREEGIAMDARARLEDARQDILKYIKARWLGIRSQKGFEPLENWCLKELSDELEQPVDELLQSSTVLPRLTTKTGLKLSSTKVHRVDSDAFSMVSAPPSLHASVLNRNTSHQSSGTLSNRRATTTVNSADVDVPVPVALATSSRKIRRVGSKDRAPSVLDGNSGMSASIPDSLAAMDIASPTPSTSKLGPPQVLDTGSVSKKKGPAFPALKDRPSPTMNKSARLRQSSTASKMSARSTVAHETARLNSPPSVTSLQALASLPSQSITEGNQGLAALSRPASIASTRSRLVSTENESRSRGAKTPNSPKYATGGRPSSVASTVNKRRPSISSAKSSRSTSASTMQPSTKSPTCPRPAVPSLPRTLAKSPGKDQPPPNEKVNTSTGRTPPGVILQVGIECVITHGQSKFKATVRYIGKVLFDNESYVGVEVPTDNSDLPADLQWTDGIVDGVRYFALAQRKKFEITKARSGVRPVSRDFGSNSAARSPPCSSSTRGLFVKPSQVVYVF